jgi:TPR repeat protein
LNRARAFDLHSKLVSLNYPAAFDNLGWMYINDKKDLNTAVGLFRKGVQLGDSDSMISIADLLEKGRIGPTSPDETRLKLLTRAADLGNPNAIRAVQVELEKEQIARQNKALEIERQRQAAEIFGQVLRQFAR